VVRLDGVRHRVLLGDVGLNEQLEFLRLIADRLDGADIPYMLTGSMAMSVYAPPRMTRDLDFVIECQASDAHRMVGLFSGDCYIEESAVVEAIREHRSFNIIHNEWIIKADFIVRKDSEYRRVEFGRRRRVSMGEWELWVAMPEDLLLSKLQWAKNGTSDLQKGDARQLASSVEHLDWEYLRSWGSRLGLDDLLEEIKPHD
jgi:hypothetical protein